MDTIIRAVIGYFVLLLVVRVLSRRPGSQMTLFEFVLIFLMGGIVILATVDRDRSLTNCTFAVITVGLLHRALSWAKSRSAKIGAVLDGSPLVIIKHGQWQHEAIANASIRREDVAAAARGRGIPSLERVDYAVLERNGGISVFEKKS
jgi:uncharacterized membrane protein YcaP (DUF421 family)